MALGGRKLGEFIGPKGKDLLQRQIDTLYKKIVGTFTGDSIGEASRFAVAAKDKKKSADWWQGELSVCTNYADLIYFRCATNGFIAVVYPGFTFVT